MVERLFWGRGGYRSLTVTLPYSFKKAAQNPMPCFLNFSFQKACHLFLMPGFLNPTSLLVPLWDSWFLYVVAVQFTGSNYVLMSLELPQGIPGIQFM